MSREENKGVVKRTIFVMFLMLISTLVTSCNSAANDDEIANRLAVKSRIAYNNLKNVKRSSKKLNVISAILENSNKVVSDYSGSNIAVQIISDGIFGGLKISDLAKRKERLINYSSRFILEDKLLHCEVVFDKTCDDTLIFFNIYGIFQNYTDQVNMNSNNCEEFFNFYTGANFRVSLSNLPPAAKELFDQFLDIEKAFKPCSSSKFVRDSFPFGWEQMQLELLSSILNTVSTRYSDEYWSYFNSKLLEYFAVIEENSKLSNQDYGSNYVAQFQEKIKRIQNSNKSRIRLLNLENAILSMNDENPQSNLIKISKLITDIPTDLVKSRYLIYGKLYSAKLYETAVSFINEQLKNIDNTEEREKLLLYRELNNALAGKKIDIKKYVSEIKTASSISFLTGDTDRIIDVFGLRLLRNICEKNMQLQESKIPWCLSMNIRYGIELGDYLGLFEWLNKTVDNSKLINIYKAYKNDKKVNDTIALFAGIKGVRFEEFKLVKSDYEYNRTLLQYAIGSFMAGNVSYLNNIIENKQLISDDDVGTRLRAFRVMYQNANISRIVKKLITLKNLYNGNFQIYDELYLVEWLSELVEYEDYKAQIRPIFSNLAERIFLLFKIKQGVRARDCRKVKYAYSEYLSNVIESEIQSPGEVYRKLQALPVRYFFIQQLAERDSMNICKLQKVELQR